MATEQTCEKMDLHDTLENALNAADAACKRFDVAKAEERRLRTLPIGDAPGGTLAEKIATGRRMLREAELEMEKARLDISIETMKGYASLVRMIGETPGVLKLLAASPSSR